MIEVGTTYPDQAEGEGGGCQDRGMVRQVPRDGAGLSRDDATPGDEVGEVGLIGAPRVGRHGSRNEPENLGVITAQ
jgi:hypothetical protein